MEGLRQLQQQAAALRVEMPEQSSLALALDRVDVWQVGALLLPGSTSHARGWLVVEPA